MAVYLDLSRIAWAKRHGEIMAYGTWLKTDERGWRPVLVLVRAGDEMSDHCVPCIVTMDRIWLFDEAIGSEIVAADTIAGFIDPLRLTLSKATAFKLLSIIRDHIGDVLQIPPRPFFADPTVVAEAIILDNETGRTVEKEIVENV